MKSKFSAPSASILVSMILLYSSMALASHQKLHALRREVTAAMPINQLLQRDVFQTLENRQASSTCQDATETPCADGNGCCPFGSQCTSTVADGQAYGICAAACLAGAETCTTPITACCPEVGLTCGNDGSCTAPSSSIAQQPPSSNVVLTPSSTHVSATFSSVSPPPGPPPPPVSSSKAPGATPASTSVGSPTSPIVVSESATGAGQTVADTSRHAPSPRPGTSGSESPGDLNTEATGSQASASSAAATVGTSSATKEGMGFLTALLALLSLFIPRI